MAKTRPRRVKTQRSKTPPTAEEWSENHRVLTELEKRIAHIQRLLVRKQAEADARAVARRLEE